MDNRHDGISSTVSIPLLQTRVRQACLVPSQGRMLS